MRKINLVPITGGWRVLLGAALAGTVFLVIKPAIQKEHQLGWAVVFGGLGAATAWVLELYKPAVRIKPESDTELTTSVVQNYPSSISVNPVEITLSSDLTEAVKTLSSLVSTNTVPVSSPTLEVSSVSNVQLPQSPTPLPSKGSLPYRRVEQAYEPPTEVIQTSNSIIEDGELLLTPDYDYEDQPKLKPKRLGTTSLEQDIWNE